MDSCIPLELKKMYSDSIFLNVFVLSRPKIKCIPESGEVIVSQYLAGRKKWSELMKNIWCCTPFRALDHLCRAFPESCTKLYGHSYWSSQHDNHKNHSLFPVTCHVHAFNHNMIIMWPLWGASVQWEKRGCGFDHDKNRSAISTDIFSTFHEPVISSFLKLFSFWIKSLGMFYAKCEEN